ncbi:MAG: glycosyltransferase family 2 protein [Gammaproteobacteria bacterium]|nr:glycosyltransferase family 2 protein [Gammaproteobacteria bacterium]
MISLVVPTFNRAYTLKCVADSYYEQADVTEIIFVDDAGEDETQHLVEQLAVRHIDIKTLYLKNPQRRGASYSRFVGVKAASNDLILFCDDDDFLGPDYARTCQRKMDEHGAAIVSGRHFYRLPDEPVSDAIKRFGFGISNQPTFDPLRFRLNTDARFEGDLELPFTHGIYLVRRALLLQYGLDPYYSKGNGFREESDVQIRAYLDGHRIVVTNAAHAVHLNASEVRSGGQRVGRLSRFYWTVYYTRYFYAKYFNAARKTF